MLERDLTSFLWLDLRQTNKHIMQRQYKNTAHSIILNYCQCLQSRVHFILSFLRRTNVLRTVQRETIQVKCGSGDTELPLFGDFNLHSSLWPPFLNYFFFSCSQ